MSTSMIDAGPSVAPNGEARHRLRLFDVLFVFALPPVCFFLEPGVTGATLAAPLALWIFAGLGMAAFALSYRNWQSSNVRDMILGMLWTAAAGAGLIGLLLLPFSLYGMYTAIVSLIPFLVLIFFVGLLGLVPFCTLAAFNHRARALRSLSPRPCRSPVVLGVLVMLALPVAVQTAESRWLNPRLAQLGAADPHEAIAALRAIKAYPFWLGRGYSRFCARITRDPPTDPAVMAELRGLLGDKYDDDCRRLWSD